MSNAEKFEKERTCYETLFEILDYYAYQRATFDPSDVSAMYIINRIKKNISKNDIDIRLEVLSRILYLTNDRIIAGVGTKTVFHSLDGISLDLVKKIKAEKSKENKKQEYIIQKENKLFDRIDFLYDRLSDKDRSSLVDIETDLNKRIMSVVSTYRIYNVTAFVDVLSRLYMGVYGKNKKSLIQELDSLDIKVNKSGKLLPIMNNDLLKYHIVSLAITLNECEKSASGIKPKYSEGSYNRYEYNKLLCEINFTGRTIAKKFEKEFGISPKMSLIEEPYDRSYDKMLASDQIMFDEILDNAPIKKIRRDK